MKKKFIGIIPAAGKATRLGTIPCSKEILPIGFIEDNNEEIHSGVLTCIDHSLMAFAEANINTIKVTINPEKEDIKKYVNKRKLHDNLKISFKSIQNSPNILISINSAISSKNDNIVLLFPDIIFDPKDMLIKLKETFHNKNPDIVLALFPTDRGDKMDIVSTDKNNRIKQVIPKPGSGISGYTWISAIWNQKFSGLLAKEIKQTETITSQNQEIFIGHIVDIAIKKDLKVLGVPFNKGWCSDLGTPTDLKKYWRKYT